MMALSGQPLISPVLADGYYDDDGNWIEDDPAGYDPWSDASPDIDTDEDGITDFDEVWGYDAYSVSQGTGVFVTTDPTNPDSDWDDLPDGW